MIARLFERWTWVMAWRDSRRARARHALYVLAMCFGVGALVAIGSFGKNVDDALASEARGLLGADFRLRSRKPFDDETEALLTEATTAGASIARQMQFPSMAYFPDHDATRLVAVRASDGGYPFSGVLETDPPSAAADFRDGKGALVDIGLLLASGATVGDTVRIGRTDYPVLGGLKSIPGETATAAVFGPRVFVPLSGLDPALLVKGSRINYLAYLSFDAARGESATFEQKAKSTARASDDLSLETVRSTEERWGRRMSELRGFLNLVAFVALLLGGLGVGSAMAVWVRRKIPSVATLRCLGATADQAFAIHTAQALLLGAFGALLGGALGVLIQQALPRVLADALPLNVEARLAPLPIAIGMSVGLLFAVLFALLPLLPLRLVPPLLALRPRDDGPARRDPARAALVAFIAVMVLAFAWTQFGDLGEAAAYTAGLAAALAILRGTAWLLMATARRLSRMTLPYEWRQGISNLHRPGNQTGVLLTAIGLAAFLILTLYQVRGSLLAQLERATGEDRPNLVLFDVQDHQRDEVVAGVARPEVEILETIPIVTMRIAAVNGQSTKELRGRRDDDRPRWAVTREYRSTYRDHAAPYEEVVEGSFDGRYREEDGVTPVSMEVEQAKRLGVDIGDAIDWDVQGRIISSRVTSLREVDWAQFRANFFAVFPAGVLEDAPKFHVVMARATDIAAIAAVQKDLVKAFPNVSAIDVTLVEKIADDLFSRIAFVIRFMAGFSIATGLLVLIGSVLTTRYQRIEESALLRTLGAVRRQVEKIARVEFLALGTLATLTGTALSVLGAGLTVSVRFSLPFEPPIAPLCAAFAIIVAATSTIGYFANKGLHSRPPLHVLRAEE